MQFQQCSFLSPPLKPASITSTKSQPTILSLPINQVSATPLSKLNGYANIFSAGNDCEQGSNRNLNLNNQRSNGCYQDNAETSSINYNSLYFANNFCRYNYADLLLLQQQSNQQLHSHSQLKNLHSPQPKAAFLPSSPVAADSTTNICINSTRSNEEEEDDNGCDIKTQSGDVGNGEVLNEEKTHFNLYNTYNENNTLKQLSTFQQQQEHMYLLQQNNNIFQHCNNYYNNPCFTQQPYNPNHEGFHFDSVSSLFNRHLMGLPEKSLHQRDNPDFKNMHYFRLVYLFNRVVFLTDNCSDIDVG